MTVCERSRCHVQLFATPWTVAHQAPPSMEFSRQKYCSGLPFPSARNLPKPETAPSLLYCRQILYIWAIRGIGWRGRWEGGLAWGIHVYPWLIRVGVWQRPLQCCGVIRLQLIKRKEIKNLKKKPEAWRKPVAGTVKRSKGEWGSDHRQPFSYKHGRRLIQKLLIGSSFETKINNLFKFPKWPSS